MRLLAGLIVVALGWQAGRSALLDPEHVEWQRPAPARSTVTLETSRGLIELDVRREWSPHGVDRFYNLARHGFYDGARFFRIRPGRWVQFGIPGDPAVARTWRNRTIPDDPRVLGNERGTVAYAFKDPNGRTTQVFINLGDNQATHDAEPFVPFARVTLGMDVADALNAEYGEGPGGIRAGKQDAFFEGGNKYLQDLYPRLDYISRARIK